MIFNEKKFIEKLKNLVDFKVELPDFVFKSHHYNFWFGERSILDLTDNLIDLLENSSKYFDGNILFSLFDVDNLDHIIFMSNDLEDYRFYKNLQNYSLHFPIVITTSEFDWVLFESGCEEIGVIALTEKALQKKEFVRYLDQKFYSMAELKSIRDSNHLYQQQALWFCKHYENYFINSL